jgi:hypothetical protein
MGLFKFQNYSAIKNAQDNPRVIASVETVNGNVFGIVDTANAANTATTEVQTPFADAAAAQGDVWVMMNIVDKPEVRNYADYSVLAGEYIRAFKLNSVIGEKVELSGDLVINGGGLPPAVGVALVPTVAADAPNLMIWKTIANPAGYSCYLEITGITTFGLFTIDNTGVGYEAKIKSA